MARLYGLAPVICVNEFFALGGLKFRRNQSELCITDVMHFS